MATKANNNNTNSTTTTTTVRRAVHNMTTSSVFAGNKMKHIKKEDGMPLWRRDIQYDFLRAVFEDRNAVFTNFHENRRGCTFSDIYVDSMARSSKTSKILRDKLLSDRAAANNMAMVCLLVNVGRMNTTLNCRFFNTSIFLMLENVSSYFPPLPFLLRHPHPPFEG